jgi:UDP-N-acetylmuramoyl-tripeptide--D-alanyl-D-alanine ligase
VVRKLSSGCQLIDDSYNANVASMTAAINLLSQFSGTRILVIGDMAELGEHARECHQQIGVHAREVGIDRLLSCGVLTQFAQRGFSYAGTDNQSDKLNVSSNEDHFSEQADLIKTLIKEAKNGVTILVKGSRSAHMENVIKALENEMAHSSADRDIEKTSAQNIASLAGDQ